MSPPTLSWELCTIAERGWPTPREVGAPEMLQHAPPGGVDRSQAGKMRMWRQLLPWLSKRKLDSKNPPPGVWLCGHVCPKAGAVWFPRTLLSTPPANPPTWKVSARCQARQEHPPCQQQDKLEPVATSALQGREQPRPPPPTLARPAPHSAPAAPALGVGPSPHPLPGRAGQGGGGPRARASPGPLRRAEPGRALRCRVGAPPAPPAHARHPWPPSGSATDSRRPRRRCRP